MTAADFIEKIRYGSDIMFDVLGRHYTILTWPEEGIAICEQNVYEELRYFDSAESLVKEFEVDGIPLAELCQQVVITDYTSNGREYSE